MSDIIVALKASILQLEIEIAEADLMAKQAQDGALKAAANARAYHLRQDWSIRVRTSRPGKPLAITTVNDASTNQRAPSLHPVEFYLPVEFVIVLLFMCEVAATLVTDKNPCILQAYANTCVVKIY